MKCSLLLALLGFTVQGRSETLLGHLQSSRLPPTVGSGGIDPYNNMRGNVDDKKVVQLGIKSDYPWFESKTEALKHCTDNHACDGGKCYIKRRLEDLRPCPKPSTMLCEHPVADKFFSYECKRQSPLPWNGDRQWGLHKNKNVHSFSEKS